MGAATKPSVKKVFCLNMTTYNEIKLLNVSDSKTIHIRFGVFPPYCYLASKVRSVYVMPSMSFSSNKQ